MIPILEVEAYYEAINRNIENWQKELILAMGPLCEQWLLEFDGFETILNDHITGPSSNERLDFVLAMALIIPSTNTPEIFSRYKPYLESKGNCDNISNLVMSAIEFSALSGQVDYYPTFESFNDKEIFWIACSIYEFWNEQIKLHAIAKDNLTLFLLALPDDQPSCHDKFNGLSQFPVNKESSIYKHLVKRPDDEKDLFLARIKRFQQNRLSVFDINEGYLYSSPGHEVQLHKGGNQELQSAKPGDIQDPHEDPGFEKHVHADMERIISTLFKYEGMPPGGAKTCHVVTRALLGVGVTPQQIISYGPGGISGDGELANLPQSLALLNALDDDGRKLFSVLFDAYLKEFTTQEVLENCAGLDLHAHLYRLTGKNAYLEAAPDNAKDRFFSSDLGL